MKELFTGYTELMQYATDTTQQAESRQGGDSLLNVGAIKSSDTHNLRFPARNLDVNLGLIPS